MQRFRRKTPDSLGAKAASEDVSPPLWRLIGGPMNEEGKTIKVPNAVKKMLLADEQVKAVIKQSRLKAAITPDSIVITDQRVIRYSPSAMGLRKEIEDYRYEDIANLRIDKGILFATITVKRRFMSEDLILDDLPRGQADYISRAIQENLRRVNAVATSSVTANKQSPPAAPEDPLQVLKLRFARGEITKEQFEDMKRALE
jgi:Bacterial PH domain/Short C-terminal domain